jgi:hypothetical protein
MPLGRLGADEDGGNVDRAPPSRTEDKTVGAVLACCFKRGVLQGGR